MTQWIQKTFLSFFCLILVAVFSLPQTSYAQLNTSISYANDISLIVSPEYPEPGETITARLSSFVVDLNIYRIVWTINGESTLSGIGEITTSAKVGETGTETVINAQIILPTEIVTKQRTVIPGGIDILWEAPQTYVPAFYKGKALPARESDIRITAIPRVPSFASPESIKNNIFTWEHNYTVRGSLSGYGKNTYAFSNSFDLKSENIGLTLESADGTFKASDRITIPLVKPEVLFYRESPTLGYLPQALTKNISSEIGQLALVAEPYYFSVTDTRAPNLDFTWRIGDQTLAGPSGEALKKRALIEPFSAGRAFLGVKIDNLQTFFQVADEDLQIIFR
jgi:hypothetical protein